ncbi:MAG TPA: ABC transporter permease [Vicinamibacterales bacterium]|nr:ABC transporter permease [Vicinamibacterales bacterium]
MSPERRHTLATTLVRAAALLVPAEQRDDWKQEWHGELASLGDLPSSQRRPIRRAAGAFADAFWLRQRSIADFDWIDDLRFGVRQLAQHTGFAVTAISILSLGLAATVTMFSVTDQILLRPLPYPDSDRIVTVWETRAPESTPLEVSPGNLLDWRDRARSFEHLAGVAPNSIDVAATPRPEVWFSAKVTEGFFETFGVVPLAGRLFHAGEYQKGRDRVMVISEAFWRRRFAADPSIVGRSMATGEGPHVIVGIVPRTFEPRLLATATGYRDVWQPKAIESYEPQIRGGGYWAAVGRVRSGISLETAQAEMNAISRQLALDHPRSNKKTGVHLMPLRAYLVGNVQLAVQLLAGAVALVLLIACVNVANLLLARGSARDREIAVRVALGARRPRIVQQLLLESTLIASIGGLVGVALATGVLAAIVRLGPPAVPWIDTLHLDWRAAAFAAVMSLVVALVSGVLPAYRVARAGLASAGRATATGDPSQHRLRAGLVILEVALALILVTGAGLLIRSFVGLMNVDTGFQRDRVLVAQVFAWDYNATPAQLRTFFDTTLERLRALPAVQHVGAVSAMPFIESNINIQNVFAIAGRPQPVQSEAPRAHLSVATPGYFDAMRIPLKAGRLLDDRDGPERARVAVISEAMARRHWPSLDAALGDRLRFRFSGTQMEVEVVGVVSSLRHDTLDGDVRDELFMPLAQTPFGSMTFVVRSAGDASVLLEPTRAAIWATNPNQTIYRSATLDELVAGTVSPRRFALAVIIGFAGLAWLLAVLGVYGVLSAIMTTRLREVGLRVALGANRWDIIQLVVGRGLVLTVVGLAVGLAGALGAGRLLQAFLFGITPADPVAISASAGFMLVAALIACYLPARRAASADPVTVLRAE